MVQGENFLLVLKPDSWNSCRSFWNPPFFHCSCAPSKGSKKSSEGADFFFHSREIWAFRSMKRLKQVRLDAVREFFALTPLYSKSHLQTCPQQTKHRKAVLWKLWCVTMAPPDQFRRNIFLAPLVWVQRDWMQILLSLNSANHASDHISILIQWERVTRFFVCFYKMQPFDRM